VIITNKKAAYTK